jgi:hypothetical protein
MFGLALISLGLTGCAEIQEMKINVRNRYLSKEAWESLRETNDCMNFESDFGRGFRAGYYDVANGGNGCPPPLPPQRYWSVRYMSLKGRERTEAWFAGYRYGAMVAQQDGIGTFLELPTSLPDESTRRELPLPPKEPEESAVPAEETPAEQNQSTSNDEDASQPDSSTEKNTETPMQEPPSLDAPLLPDRSELPAGKPAELAPETPANPGPVNPNK